MNFIELTLLFRHTQRGILAVGEDRNENDAEHSYQLAMWVWWVIENKNLQLDSNLAIKYALIHDLAEALTGDKHIFDTQGRLDKEVQEAAAIAQIQSMFPEWTGYSQLINNYMELKDEESRLVNGLDKVLPVINLIADGGRSWKREGTTLEKLVANKRPKVQIHPIAEALWAEVEVELRAREMELFGK
jgi:putative hydrolases of HD superfamily